MARKKREKPPARGWLARLHFEGGGTLTLGTDWAWSAAGAAPPAALGVAGAMAQDYECKPEHGYPGHLHARQVAAKLGQLSGRPVGVEVCPVPPPRPGVVE